MPDRTLPNIALLGFWALGEGGWKPGMDANLLKLSTLVQGRVLSQTTALPGSPTDGEIYIVPHSAGANPDQIAVRDDGAWVYYTPLAGWRMYVIDISAVLIFTGSIWVADGNAAFLGPAAVANIAAGAPVNVSGAITLDQSLGEIKRLSATGNITSIAFAGWPATGIFARMIVELTTNGHTITLPGSPDVLWSGNVTPTVSANNDFVFYTKDGGTTVRGAVAWQGA